MKRLARKWRWELGGAGIGLLVTLVFWGPEIFEPQDAPEYIPVEIVDYRMESRGSQHL
jgi:hypothetical protein